MLAARLPRITLLLTLPLARIHRPATTSLPRAPTETTAHRPPTVAAPIIRRATALRLTPRPRKVSIASRTLSILQTNITASHTNPPATETNTAATTAINTRLPEDTTLDLMGDTALAPGTREDITLALQVDTTRDLLEVITLARPEDTTLDPREDTALEDILASHSTEEAAVILETDTKEPHGVLLLKTVDDV